MIEDEVLGQSLVDDLYDYYVRNKRKLDCRYRLSLYAYPDERFVKIIYKLHEYPEGYKVEILENFKSLANSFLSNRIPGWTIQIYAE